MRRASRSRPPPPRPSASSSSSAPRARAMQTPACSPRSARPTSSARARPATPASTRAPTAAMTPRSGATPAASTRCSAPARSPACAMTSASSCGAGSRPGGWRPSLVAVLPVIADAQIELGRYGAAERTLQQLLDIKPNLTSYSRVSYLRELTGDLPGAVEAMRLAVSAGGGDPENVAYVQVLLGDLELQQRAGRGGAARLHGCAPITARLSGRHGRTRASRRGERRSGESRRSPASRFRAPAADRHAQPARPGRAGARARRGRGGLARRRARAAAAVHGGGHAARRRDGPVRGRVRRPGAGRSSSAGRSGSARRASARRTPSRWAHVRAGDARGGR